MSEQRKKTPTPPPLSFTEVILDSVADGVFTVDANWRITSFNRAAEQITGVSREFAIGSPCHTVFRSSVCESGCVLKETMRTGENITCKAIYIVRPDGQSVPISISTAVLSDEQGKVVGGVETFRDLSLVENLRGKLSEENSFHDIVSRSHSMRRIFSILPDIARSDSTVLIQGKSGTGKELVARAIHELSPRRDGPLVAINCGALPDTLLESELFGHKKGAFTDAKADRRGKFDMARGGTLFLDEVGDVSPALQARLLRVLQERVYEPLGDDRSRRVDVRVVAATNKDIAAMIADGRFRQDLYYRLNVVELTLPELADRKEDIPLLADHFIGQLSRRQGKEIIGFSDDAMATLLRHDFPGNVRELKNVVEYAHVLCRGGLIQVEHLPRRLVDAVAPSEPALVRAPTPRDAPPSGEGIEAMERRLIVEALRRNNNHREKTARELGIGKTTLWRKMKKYAITP